MNIEEPGEPTRRPRIEPQARMPHDAVLALQRSAGNRAVAARLAVARTEDEVQEVRPLTLQELANLLSPRVVALVQALEPAADQAFRALPPRAQKALLLLDEPVQVALLQLPTPMLLMAIRMLAIYHGGGGGGAQAAEEQAIVPHGGAQQANVGFEELMRELAREAAGLGERGRGGDRGGIPNYRGATARAGTAGGARGPGEPLALGWHAESAPATPAGLGGPPQTAPVGPGTAQVQPPVQATAAPPQPGPSSGTPPQLTPALGPHLPPPMPMPSLIPQLPPLPKLEPERPLEGDREARVAALTAPLSTLDGEAATLAAAAHGWSGRIAAASAVAPRTAQALLNRAVPHAASFEQACTSTEDLRARLQDLVDRAQLDGPEGSEAVNALQGAVPTYRASLERARTLHTAPLAAGLSAADGSLALVEAVAALPGPVRAAVETWPQDTMPVLRSLGTAGIPQLAALPPDVLEALAVTSQSEALRVINRKADVAACRNDIATLNTHLPTTDAAFPAGDPIVAHWRNRRTALVRRAGTANCTNVWHMRPGEIATLRNDIATCDAAFQRLNIALGQISNLCTAMPPTGGANNNLWILDQHLGKSQPLARRSYDAFLAALQANAPGWNAQAEFQDVLDEALYAYVGLQQSHPFEAGLPRGAKSPAWGQNGKGQAPRGAGSLDTVSWNPQVYVPGWATQLGNLKANANRHLPANQMQTGLRCDGGYPIKHTTDPAKLGAGGSRSTSSPRDRPGSGSLKGSSYEYSVLTLNAARLIEVDRGGGHVSWYLSMNHYATYQLIIEPS